MNSESKDYDLYYEMIRGIESGKYNYETYYMAQKALVEFITAYQKKQRKTLEIYVAAIGLFN